METCTMKPEVERKPVKPIPPPKPAQKGASAGGELCSRSLSESSEDSGRVFSENIPEKSLKPIDAARPDEDSASLRSDVSASDNDHSENSDEQGLRPSNKAVGAETPGQMLASCENLPEDNNNINSINERREIFAGIFNMSSKLVEAAEPEEIECPDTELLIRNNITDNKQEKGGGLLRKLLRKTLGASGPRTESPVQGEKQPSMSSEMSEVTTAEEKSILTNVFRSLQKAAAGATANKEQDVNGENLPSSGYENQTDTAVVKLKKRGLAGIFQRSASNDDVFDEESNSSKDKKLLASWENLLEAATSMIKKSPQPAPRSIAAEDLSNTGDLPPSWDSVRLSAGEDLSSCDELSISNNLSDATPTKISQERKIRFAGMFRRTQKTVEQQDTKSEDTEAPEGGKLRRRRTIKKKRRVVSFRVKKTLPRTPRTASSSQSQQGTVELQPVEMAAYPAENDSAESEQEAGELVEWWSTVQGWTEWNETSHSQEEDEEMIVEQAADRVYLAARLFVHLFNQRGASLQQRIMELLCVAEAADQFHKKTVRAAVGGGVASVAGSLATITGLILAPFTFGASVIVTAVGISVATAGSLTSATANITDTVHSSMDRKKVEKMILGYQEEIRDIRECLEFVQEGMDTLQEWNFEQYCQSASKKALNHNVKHVVKEGGRAGKELMINTSTLISTVQLLNATGGAVKAAQVISITTGVMSALFLALDVFFLAKDSHELRKGAKTQFAAKIREVCRDLQHGLLELNKVKTQLQKTMDGIEVEEYEEIEEVEVEIEDDLEKLAELEQELDLLEEKLDKKGEEELKKSKWTEKENLKSKEKKEKSSKAKGDPAIKKELAREKYAKNEEESKKENNEVEGRREPKLDEFPDVQKEKKGEETIKTAKENLKERSKKMKGNKDRKEQRESNQDEATKDTGTNRKTHEEKKVNETEAKYISDDSTMEDRSRELDSERMNTEREHHRKRPEIRGIKPKWKPVNKEVESVESMKTHGSRSSSERTSRHEMRDEEKESNRKETEEDRAVKAWRAEKAKASREQTETKAGSDSKNERKGAHARSGVKRESRGERDWRSSTEDSDCQSQHWRPTAMRDDQRPRGGEKRGTTVESLKSKFERAAGTEEEEERGKRREDGERQRRHREHEHSRPDYQADGLYI